MMPPYHTTRLANASRYTSSDEMGVEQNATGNQHHDTLDDSILTLGNQLSRNAMRLLHSTPAEGLNG